MKPEKMLARGIEIATLAHSGQFDRGGKPYILHPLHIMNQLMYDYELATIGVMHDVIEDSAKNKDPERVFTLDRLADEGFSDRVLVGLEIMTHDPEDDYLTVYIPKIANNFDTLRVKRKDLDHNSRATRLKGLRDKDHERMKKYHTAYAMLGEAKRKFLNV